MKVSFGQMVQDLKRQSLRRRMSLTVILVLSLFVSTGIVWKLRSVGITMANDVSCGIEEHEHDAACFEYELTCGMDGLSDSDGNPHVHTDDCRTKKIICGIPEHVHSIRCCDNALVPEKKPEKEIKVVEIPDAEIVQIYNNSEENSDSDMNSDFDSDSDSENAYDTDSEEFIYEDDSESEFDERSDTESDKESDESDGLSEEEYNKLIGLLQERRNNRPDNVSMMEIVQNPGNDKIYRKLSNGYYAIPEAGNQNEREPIFLQVGTQADFVINKSNNNNNYFYYTNENGGYIENKAIPDNYPFKINGTTSFNNNQALVKISADKCGVAGIGYEYDSGKHVKQIIHVYETQKILKVEGSREIEAPAEGWTVSSGDSVTFCVYSDRSLTYRGNDNGNTIYKENGPSGINSSNIQTLWFDENGLPKASGSTNNDSDIRRYQVTYKFNDSGDYTISFYGTRVTVKVESIYKNFDYKKLYNIYWVKEKSDGTKEEVLNEIPVVHPGDTLTFCIYTDYKNTINKDSPQVDGKDENGKDILKKDASGNIIYGEHYMYSNNGDSISGVKNTTKRTTFSDTRDASNSDRIIRRIESTYQIIDIGDYEILYNAVTGHKIHVVPNSLTEDIVLLKYDNKYINLTELAKRNETELAKFSEYEKYVQTKNHNFSGNYVLETGDSIELIGYTARVAEGQEDKRWFYNSYVRDENLGKNVEMKNLTYTNKAEYDGNVKIVRSRVRAAYPDISSIHFGDLSFHVEVKDHLENEIYVVTKLGERSIHKVHERGSTYEPNGTDAENRYILMIDGTYRESTQICIYTSNTSGDFRCYNADGNASDVVTIVRQAGGVDADRKVSAMITANRSGEAVVKFDIGNGKTADFYVIVYDSSGGPDMKDHADIEIADGGYYEVVREVYSDNNTKKTVYYEKYDTYILGVNYGDIIGVRNDNTIGVLYRFTSDEYNQTGRPGEQQYELNSKQVMNGQELYDRYKVHSAKFDVSIRMIPSEIKITEYKVINNETDLSSARVIKDAKLEDIEKPIDDSKDIDHVIFNFDMQGVIDAYNKCSNHSGLDFNVTDCLNEVITQISIKAEKVFQDRDEKKLSGFSKSFDFELKETSPSEKTSVVSNKADGSIAFEDVYVQDENTILYTYSLKEVIPDDADGNYKYYSDDKMGISFEGKSFNIYVKTCKVDGLMKTYYYTNPERTIEYKEAIVFKNTVYQDKKVDILVNKKWIDGNKPHDNDSIQFKVYCNDQPARINNSEVFELNKNNNWAMAFTDIPVQTGKESFIYRVEETTSYDGYYTYYPAPLEKNGVMTLGIVNTLEGNKTISVQKQWIYPEGHVIDNPVCSSVNAVVSRKYAKDTVKVNIIDGNTNEVITSFIENTYNTKSLNFKLSPFDEQFFRLGELINCSCIIDNGEFKVTDVDGQATVNIIYKEIRYSFETDEFEEDGPDENGKMKYKYTGPWDKRGAVTLLGARWIDYARNGSNQDGIHPHSLSIENRKSDGKQLDNWKGASLMWKKTGLRTGKRYSVSFYAAFNEENAIDYTNIELGVNYRDTNNNEKYSNNPEAVARFSVTREWKQLSNISLMIPGANGETNQNLYIQTNEPIKEGNLYKFLIDEFIIAPEGMSISVEAVTGKVIRNTEFSMTVTSAQKSDSEIIWITDSDWSRTIVLSQSEYWIKTIDSLQEEPDRIYRYDVKEESSVPGYDIVQYDNCSVNSNTPDTPMIIKNRAIAYQLPATGGTGIEKYAVVGAVLIFGATAGLMISRRRKRKSSA